MPNPAGDTKKAEPFSADGDVASPGHGGDTGLNYYFHLPFCRAKCGYCAFYSESGVTPELIAAYLDRLERELEYASPLPEADTVYLGGGTPTILSEDELKRLFALIRRHLKLSERCEISIEANPETLNPSKVELLRSQTTRISLGVQSFSSRLRRALGRQCPDSALTEALRLVAAADFPHWNIDLIYAIPGETTAIWYDDLHRAADCGIDHLSCYALTPEENTRLGSKFKIDDRLSREMYDVAPAVLENYGIFRYEVSNFSRPGSECRHNLNVWRGGILRGFGPSAAGFNGHDRMTSAAPLDVWLAGADPEWDRISPERRLAEIFAVNLRTISGWTPELWSAVPGADDWGRRLSISSAAAENMPPGWWKITPRSIKLSDEGLCFWDNIAEFILP